MYRIRWNIGKSAIEKDQGEEKTASEWILRHQSPLVNCDQGTGQIIDLSAHEYNNYKVVKFWTIPELENYLQKNPQNAVQIESKTVDTGERKTFFGHLANTS